MTDHESLPPPERGQHGEIVITDVKGAGLRATVKHDRKIDLYADKGRLGHGRAENDRHYEAAKRYLRLAYQAMPKDCQSTLANLQKVDGHAPDTTPEKADAMTKLVDVHRAVGPMAASCLLAVVFCDHSCHDWIRGDYAKRGWGPPRREVGIEFLRDALWRLSKHWGLS